ncbi:hypothetical protein [Verrucomicrobium spinosum]|uniref:hypothetical protein n=1 Tax=Verrucomicrobium spinosum TaxID=2736 RepID=UPI000B2F4DCF|nr:hypothetical protein [Verrucomicrobium spinosum]
MDLIPRGRRTWEAWLLDLAATLTSRDSQLCLLLPEAGPEWFQQELEAVGGKLTSNPVLRGRFDKRAVQAAITGLQPTTVVVGFYPMLSPTVLSTVRMRPVTEAYYIDQSSLEIPQRMGWKGLATRLRGRVFSRRYQKIITVSDFKAGRSRADWGYRKNASNASTTGCPWSVSRLPLLPEHSGTRLSLPGRWPPTRG